ncbi:GerAB/ArcD/ProY family transporter [Aquisalibacillus elongatus]|uniref:Spore germination protein (Amino acid permease) n=1 Tax=Aquisalibacillus elongatus TaxID=485577 RepID=A0A3N5B3J2_9BACI|nr:GerAB/ArcD/ProY family transporter [Aquisalibacillus elongatus]RPF50120.1 spore germination protein (amino acid permease) [Aquisalibacillus elongatus]
MHKQLMISKDKQIRAAYLFIVLHTMQVGVGIAGYPRLVFMEARQDSWISIIVTGLILHLVIACMVFVLRTYEKQDLAGILHTIFGSIIGKSIAVIFVIYFYLLFFSVIVNYIEFVQVFIFPQMQSWFIGLLLLSLVWYAVLGGIRVAVGASVVFFLSTIWMMGLLRKPITFIESRHYFPVFDTAISDIFSGVLISSYTFLGFELLWVIFPFINDKKRVNRYSQLAMTFTVLMYLTITMVVIGYFSPTQLEQKVWPLLTLFKVLSFPFFERFDLLAVAIWMIIVLPNLILLGWMVTFTCKRVSDWKQKHCLVALIILTLILVWIFEDREFVNQLTDYTGKIGLGLGFIFPFLLLPFAMRHRMKRKKNHAKN